MNQTQKQTIERGNFDTEYKIRSKWSKRKSSKKGLPVIHIVYLSGYTEFICPTFNMRKSSKNSLPLIHKTAGLLGSSRVKASSIHYKVRAKIRANRASRFPCCVFHICSDKYKVKTIRISLVGQIWPNRASRFPCLVFHICSDKYKLKTIWK